MTETFSGRDDHLVYRAVTYDMEETARQLAKAWRTPRRRTRQKLRQESRRRKKKKGGASACRDRKGVVEV